MRILVVALLWGLWSQTVAAQSRSDFHAAAQTAMEAGEFGLARELSVALLHSSADLEQKRLAYSRLDAVDAARAWRFGAYADVLPSSNINSAPTERQIQIGGRPYAIKDGGRPKTGLGYRLGADARYLGVIGPGLRLESALQVTRIGYPELRRLDRWFFSPELRIRKELPRLTLEAGTYLRRTDFDVGDGSSTAQGLRLNLRSFASGALSFSLGGGYEWIDKDEQDHLDGSLAHVQIGMRHSPNARLALVAGFRLEKRAARTRHNGYSGAQIWGEARYLVRPKDVMDASFSVTHRRHDIPTPGLGQLRRETGYSFGAGWTNTRLRFFGGSPRFGCNYSQTRSSLALYSTRATNCSLSIRADF